MRNNIRYIFSILLLGGFLVACGKKNRLYPNMDEHRKFFFNEIGTDSVDGYKYSYTDIHGGYITFARFILAQTNNSLWVGRYKQVCSAQSRSDQLALANLLHYRVLGLIGEVNNPPNWMVVDTNSLCDYYQRDFEAGEWQLWYDRRSREVVFVGVGGRK